MPDRREAPSAQRSAVDVGIDQRLGVCGRAGTVWTGRGVRSRAFGHGDLAGLIDVRALILADFLGSDMAPRSFLRGERLGALPAVGIDPARLVFALTLLLYVPHYPAALPGPSDGPR
jgi:hypothetical protein